MEQSQQVLEWQAEAERRGLARGEAIGVAKGQAQGEAIGMAKGQAEALVNLLRKRFPPQIPAHLESLIRKTTDLDLIDHWMDLVLTANSLEEFQQSTGAPPPGS